MAEATKREFNASARNVRMSARKARLVMDAVRGRVADEAMVLLQFVDRRASPAVRKLIESAVANAEEYGNRNGVDIETDNLVVSVARVDEGPRMKRWRPRSRGMANPYTRFTCHMHVTVAEADYLAEQKAKGKPAWRKPRKRMSQEERLAKVGRGPAVATDKKAEKKAEKPAAKAEKPAAKAEKKPAAKKAAPKAEAKAEKKPAKKTEKKTEKKTDE
ncbi:MAG: 50S ribosomal protein L22 [Planctomycetota bacterium]